MYALSRQSQLHFARLHPRTTAAAAYAQSRQQIVSNASLSYIQTRSSQRMSNVKFWKRTCSQSFPPVRAAAADFDKESMEILSASPLSDQNSANKGDYVDDGAFRSTEENASLLERLSIDLDIKDRVVLGVGVAKLPRVNLLHPSGSKAEVYLSGANVASWRLANSSEVLYIRPDKDITNHTPIPGGIQICFPQFGPGGNSPGAPPLDAPSMQQHGFARDCEWEVLSTDEGLGDSGEDVGVTLRLADSEYTKSLWDFAFEATYTVVLEEKGLMCKLTIANPGHRTAPFSAVLHPFVSVLDAAEDNVNVVGLQGTTYFDKAAHPDKTRVREMEDNKLTFGGKTVDAIFVDSATKVGLNVGTGASVVVSNLHGFSDHVVWNPGMRGIRYGLWQNFVCVGSARVARPIKLPPEHMWTGVMHIEVWDEEAKDVPMNDAFGPLFDNHSKSNDSTTNSVDGL